MKTDDIIRYLYENAVDMGFHGPHIGDGAWRNIIEFIAAHQPKVVAVWAPDKNRQPQLVDYVIGEPDDIVAHYHYAVILEVINPTMIPVTENAHPLELNNYMLAPGGEGPQAATWKDKPHRLVYDLCAEIKRLREKA